MWHKQVIKNIEQRNTKVALFKIFTGVNMRCTDDIELKALVQQTLIDELEDEQLSQNL